MVVRVKGEAEREAVRVKERAEQVNLCVTYLHLCVAAFFEKRCVCCMKEDRRAERK